MAKIEYIEEHRPHFVLNCGDKVYITPLELIENLIQGDVCFDEVEGFEDIFKVILKEWLESHKIEKI